MTTETNIIIRKTEHSRVHPFVKDEIKFGTEMSDHMLICDYKDGKWGDPEIVPYENFSISPATSFIHYGQAIFEGVKAYRQNDGSVAVFRPEDNWKRL